MATPTRAEVETQLSNLIKILDVHRDNVGVASGNYLTRESTYVQSMETDYPAEATNALQTFRGDLNNAIQRAAQMLVPNLRDYGKFIASPNATGDLQALFDDIYQYFIDNNLRVNSRGISFGTPSAGGSNAGNGVLNRVTVDEYNFAIESEWGDPAMVAECVADEHTGADEGRELFIIKGSDRERDDLLRTGSGEAAEIRAMDAQDSAQFIGNPSFSEHDGTAGTAFTSSQTLTDWTPNTLITNFTPDTTNTYRGFLGDTTPTAIRINAADGLRQNMNVRRANFNPRVPVYVQVAYNRSVGSGTGNLYLRFGNTTTTVALSAQTGWNILRMPVGFRAWNRYWNQEDPVIEVAVTDYSSGYTLIDDIIIAPYQRFPTGGTWFALVGGSTPFLRRDKFTWADSIATDAVIQPWLWRAFNRYLPHDAAGSSITWADP